MDQKSPKRKPPRRNRIPQHGRYQQVQRRLSILYDDKLDGKITLEFYEEKFKQYAQEKEEKLSAIERRSKAQTKYFAWDKHFRAFPKSKGDLSKSIH